VLSRVFQRQCLGAFIAIEAALVSSVATAAATAVFPETDVLDLSVPIGSRRCRFYGCGGSDAALVGLVAGGHVGQQTWLVPA